MGLNIVGEGRQVMGHDSLRVFEGRVMSQGNSVGGRLSVLEAGCPSCPIVVLCLVS
jgi:hypothetical protein